MYTTNETYTEGVIRELRKQIAKAEPDTETGQNLARSPDKVAEALQLYCLVHILGAVGMDFTESKVHVDNNFPGLTTGCESWSDLLSKIASQLRGVELAMESQIPSSLVLAAYLQALMEFRDEIDEDKPNDREGTHPGD